MTGPRRKLGRHKHKRLRGARQGARERPSRARPAADTVEGALNRCTPAQRPILRSVRRLINEAVPQAEELLLYGTPTWFLEGRLCSLRARRGRVELDFARGAELVDPTGLLRDGDDQARCVRLEHRRDVHPRALKALVRQAVRLNRSG
jgi:hypothetical protein